MESCQSTSLTTKVSKQGFCNNSIFFKKGGSLQGFQKQTKTLPTLNTPAFSQTAPLHCFDSVLCQVKLFLFCTPTRRETQGSLMTAKPGTGGGSNQPSHKQTPNYTQEQLISAASLQPRRAVLHQEPAPLLSRELDSGGACQEQAAGVSAALQGQRS